MFLSKISISKIYESWLVSCDNRERRVSIITQLQFANILYWKWRKCWRNDKLLTTSPSSWDSIRIFWVHLYIWHQNVAKRWFFLLFSATNSAKKKFLIKSRLNQKVQKSIFLNENLQGETKRKKQFHLKIFTLKWNLCLWLLARAIRRH